MISRLELEGKIMSLVSKHRYIVSFLLCHTDIESRKISIL